MPLARCVAVIRFDVEFQMNLTGIGDRRHQALQLLKAVDLRIVDDEVAEFCHRFSLSNGCIPGSPSRDADTVAAAQPVKQASLARAGLGVFKSRPPVQRIITDKALARLQF